LRFSEKYTPSPGEKNLKTLNLNVKVLRFLRFLRFFHREGGSDFWGTSTK
jgi:hypothetical protein